MQSIFLCTVLKGDKNSNIWYDLKLWQINGYWIWKIMICNNIGIDNCPWHVLWMSCDSGHNKQEYKLQNC